MNKRAIIKKITAKLTSELEVYFRAAQFSRAEATQERLLAAALGRAAKPEAETERS